MNIFHQLFRMADFCMAVRSTQLWSMAIFSTDISQGNIFEKWWGILLSLYYKFTAKSVGKKY